MKKALIVAAAFVFLAAGNALAIPTIDGSLVAGEWVGSVVNAWDPNEADMRLDYDLPDTHDINWLRLYVETNGGGEGNGMYGLIDLYGNPTWTSLGSPLDPVSYNVYFDLNRNGIHDLVDRNLRYQKSGVVLYDGSFNPVSDIGLKAFMGPGTSNDPVVEFFIPSDMFWETPSPFDGEALLQNGGKPEDDSLPDEGKFTSTPEPGSMALVGMGLVGFFGSLFRRKFKA
jgi:hypothetical protein